MSRQNYREEIKRKIKEVAMSLATKIIVNRKADKREEKATYTKTEELRER